MLGNHIYLDKLFTKEQQLIIFQKMILEKNYKIEKRYDFRENNNSYSMYLLISL